MNRESPVSQAKVVLPPGFWSQAPSDQLQRLEQLLQQFLTLPGFQQGIAGFPAQTEMAAPPVVVSPTSESYSPATANPPPKAEWAPSGSTWGPLAEAWKQVQQEKQTFAPRADSIPAKIPAPPAPIYAEIAPRQEITGNIPWQFPTASIAPTDQIPIWNLAGPTENAPRNATAPEPLTSPERPEIPIPSIPGNSSKANYPPKEKASVPVQIGFAHKTLVFCNRVTDACLIRLGWPGKSMQSSFGKWILGLTGVCLMTAGTWLYFREAVDELVGQIGFGEMAPP